MKAGADIEERDDNGMYEWIGRFIVFQYFLAYVSRGRAIDALSIGSRLMYVYLKEK